MSFLRKARIYFDKEQFEIVREIILSIVVSTAVTASFTFYFNTKLDERISGRQFIYDFSRTFADNPKYRNISIAIEEQYLYGNKTREFSEYELDDYLGLLSDIWLYHKEGYIDENLFANQYNYYFCLTYKSEIINDYRGKLRSQGFTDDWTFLDEVADDLKLQNSDCKSF